MGGNRCLPAITCVLVLTSCMHILCKYKELLSTQKNKLINTSYWDTPCIYVCTHSQYSYQFQHLFSALWHHFYFVMRLPIHYKSPTLSPPPSLPLQPHYYIPVTLSHSSPSYSLHLTTHVDHFCTHILTLHCLSKYTYSCPYAFCSSYLSHIKMRIISSLLLSSIRPIDVDTCILYIELQRLFRPHPLLCL